MANAPSTATLNYDQENNTFHCQGAWSIFNIAELKKQHVIPRLSNEKKIILTGEKLTHLDSAGALFLKQFVKQLSTSEQNIELTAFNDEHLALINLIEEKQEAINYQAKSEKTDNFFHWVGVETINKLKQADGFIMLLGDLSLTILAAIKKWRMFRLPSITANVSAAGIKALPIIGLLSFLIGVVLAYQMGLQLQTYGANIFIAYLSGMAIFREFAPLITAIIVAGRTSSSFTALLGSMKINEEIDALNSMGLSPTALLVLPKVIGLLFVFPLLIFWADFFSILGAMFMAKLMLDVSYIDFLARLKDSVGLKPLLLGLYKAPAFAIIIALVGCFQGFLVRSNAESLGSQTTKSVVQALFLIIMADALFSILYSWLGI